MPRSGVLVRLRWPCDTCPMRVAPRDWCRAAPAAVALSWCRRGCMCARVVSGAWNQHRCRQTRLHRRVQSSRPILAWIEGLRMVHRMRWVTASARRQASSPGGKTRRPGGRAAWCPGGAAARCRESVHACPGTRHSVRGWCLLANRGWSPVALLGAAGGLAAWSRECLRAWRFSRRCTTDQFAPASVLPAGR